MPDSEEHETSNLYLSCEPHDIRNMRDKLKEEGVLADAGDHLLFTKDTEFSSPSAAAAVVGFDHRTLTPGGSSAGNDADQLAVAADGSGGRRDVADLAAEHLDICGT